MLKMSRLHGVAYSILKGKPAEVYPWATSVREQLMKSGMGVSYVVYISSMFFWSLVSCILTAVVSVILVSNVLPLLAVQPSSTMVIIIKYISPIFVGSLVFFIFQYYPKYRVSNHKRTIEKNLVYVSNFMNILSSAGATSAEVFLSLAKAGKVYGIEGSARAIMRDVEILGLDILTAIDVESSRSPSPDYTDLLQGYVSTITTGGDIEAYLSAMAGQLLESRKRTLSKMIDQLSLAGEIFIAALIAFPIIMITILSIMGFFGGELVGGLSPFQTMMLMVYVLIPMTAMGVLVFIDAIMSSW